MKRGQLLLALFVLLCLAGGLLLEWKVVGSLIEIRQSQHWSTTTGVVESLAKDDAGVWGVTYRFWVSGRRYEGRRIVIAFQDSAYGPIDHLFPAGKEVTVYYDPERPERCALDLRADTAGAVAMGLGGLLSLGIGLGTWSRWLRYRRKRPAEPTPESVAPLGTSPAIPATVPPPSESAGRGPLQVLAWEVGRRLVLHQPPRTHMLLWFVPVLGFLGGFAYVFSHPAILRAIGYAGETENWPEALLAWAAILLPLAAFFGWPEAPYRAELDWQDNSVLLRRWWKGRVLGLSRVRAVEVRRRAMHSGSYYSTGYRQSYEWQLVFQVKADSREGVVPYLIAAKHSYSLSQFNAEAEAVEELGQALAAALDVPVALVKDSAPSAQTEPY